jgi:predicted SprT family Zn-dependent metalloprotease
MRADEAVSLTHRMLTAVGRPAVYVRCEKFIKQPTRFGVFYRDARTILLNETYLSDDAEMRETVAHEVAHVMTLKDTEHGLLFQAALIHVRKLIADSQRSG